jgi:hypothetical protein
MHTYRNVGAGAMSAGIATAGVQNDTYYCSAVLGAFWMFNGVSLKQMYSHCKCIACVSKTVRDAISTVWISIGFS